MRRPSVSNSLTRSGPMTDFSGQRFGMLVALRRDPTSANRYIRWICRCDCGREVSRFASNLANHHATSCGCKKRRRVEAILKDQRKRCPDCQEVKLLGAFRMNPSALDGRATYCLICSRWRDRKTRLGVSREWFEGKAAEQGWKCGNRRCGRVIDWSSPIDHCHRTGAVRGILCMKCNTALGMTAEDSGRIVGLVEYLKIN
jgi:hypothetical protein